jgi:CBS-domain-containing membrane protein
MSQQVQETMSLERTYILFRNMGLRHLVVVDEHNRVRGIVTRKDLLGFKLDEAVGRALRRVESSRQLGQANWLNTTPPATPSSWRPHAAGFAAPMPAVR